MTHGLYSKAMSPAEKEVWDTIPLDTLDDEIRMCRIWLARAGAQDYEVGQNPHDPKDMTGFELTEIRRTTGGGKSSTDAVSKRPDLWARKDRLLGCLALRRVMTDDPIPRSFPIKDPGPLRARAMASGARTRELIEVACVAQEHAASLCAESAMLRDEVRFRLIARRKVAVYP
jgi:hypothetical protein